ncbi:PKD domain-containing protein, partial [Terracoccus sp. 273MFTsu3.1]|uniref:PKD domain-containing protein n=1 Tax=Terracoccus sp. 273MFTsu3.1 TaxID=1172188 RepID=UPI0005C29FA3
VLPAQANPTATHTYTTTGTFTTTVTVTNTSGRTATAQQTVTTTAQPAYVAALGSSSATTTKSSGTVTVSPIAGVRQGDLVVITLQIAAKSTTGAVAASDTAGNAYSVARDVPMSGGRLLVLTGLATRPLASGAKITATFPGSSTYQMVVDELAGVTRVDRSAAATGTSTAFSSGLTATTTAPREVVFGAVATFTRATSPTWTTSWTALTAQSAPKASLGRAYRLPTSSSTFQADGTIAGTWAALVITFKP